MLAVMMLFVISCMILCWQVDNSRSGHTEVQHSYVE